LKKRRSFRSKSKSLTDDGPFGGLILHLENNMGVINSTTLSTTRSVTKTVKDSTDEGYEVAYSGYFNAVEPGREVTVATRDSLDDPKDCTD
jgi:hypothetical protein